MTYQKKRGRDTWHWCRNCSNWPTTDYEEKPTKPTSGELCSQCREKDRDGTCQK